MIELNTEFNSSDFLKKLKQLNKLGKLTPFLLEISSEMQARISEYPPSTSANKSKRGKTHYQRGLGSVYTTVEGQARKRFNSEQLGRKWDILRSGSSAILRNKAGYSAFVHSKALQAGIHKKRGWKTDLDVWDEMLHDGTIFDLLNEYLGL
jgi:hypothetical protein